MAKEAERALIECNSFVAGLIKRRGLFGTATHVTTSFARVEPDDWRHRLLGLLRRNFFDYFGRRR
jgi:hypothetical protein